MNRLKEHYQKTVVPALQKGFSYKNPHQVPRLVKIVVSMGVGSATQNKAILDNAVKDMEQITGRKAIVTKARKSISNFKLRQGMPIGCKVTLRGEVMYEFLDRLISIVIPACATSTAFRLIPSTAEETIPLASRNRPCFRKSNMIKWMPSAA